MFQRTGKMKEYADVYSGEPNTNHLVLQSMNNPAILQATMVMFKRFMLGCSESRAKREQIRDHKRTRNSPRHRSHTLVAALLPARVGQ